MSNRRTLRRAIAGVLKQASAGAPAAANISGSNRNAIANQQNSATAEQTSESRTSVQFGRGE